MEKMRLRTMYLTDDDVDFIKEIGKGSIVGGVREMIYLSKSIMVFDDDYFKARSKVINAVDKWRAKKDELENNRTLE
jgi:hypothetical protein